MGNKQSALNNKSDNKQLEDQQFILTVTDKDTNEAKTYYGKPNESLIDVNDVYNKKFKELNKQLIPLIGENKPTNFIVKIYKKAKDKIKDALFYNKNKTNSVKDVNFGAFDIGVKSAAEITNEHVTITLGIISTTTIAIAPPIGLLIAASSMLILKTLHTIRSNHELFDIMNDLLSLLTVITEEFKITEDNNVPHLVILKNHIVKIFSLMSSINGIYNWRKMVIFPNSVINSFVKEIALINTALIVDLKIDLTHLENNGKNTKNNKNVNIETALASSISPNEFGIDGANYAENENVDIQLKKDESDKVDDILNIVVNPNVTKEDAGLNKNIIDLVVTTNAAAEDPQLRADYLTYLKQEQEQTKQGGSKYKNKYISKKTKNQYKRISKTLKSKKNYKYNLTRRK